MAFENVLFLVTWEDYVYRVEFSNVNRHLFIPRRPEKTLKDPEKTKKSQKDLQRHPKRPEKTRKDIFIVCLFITV